MTPTQTPTLTTPTASGHRRWHPRARRCGGEVHRPGHEPHDRFRMGRPHGRLQGPSVRPSGRTMQQQQSIPGPSSSSHKDQSIHLSNCRTSTTTWCTGLRPRWAPCWPRSSSPCSRPASSRTTPPKRPRRTDRSVCGTWVMMMMMQQSRAWMEEEGRLGGRSSACV